MQRFKRVFKVWNDTDGILAASEVFASFDEAHDFTVEFRRKFWIQGFYETAAGTRIFSSDIDLRIEEVRGERILHPLGPDPVVAFLVDGEGPHSLGDMIDANVSDSQAVAWFKMADPGMVYHYLAPHKDPVEIRAVFAE